MSLTSQQQELFPASETYGTRLEQFAGYVGNVSPFGAVYIRLEPQVHGAQFVMYDALPRGVKDGVIKVGDKWLKAKRVRGMLQRGTVVIGKVHISENHSVRFAGFDEIVPLPTRVQKFCAWATDQARKMTGYLPQAQP